MCLLRRCWGYVRGVHQNLPVIALTNKNISPIALLIDGTPIIAFNRVAPFSGPPHLIAGRTYSVRGILLGDMVAEMHFLEQVCPILIAARP
jgi:hypothetical protein